MGEPDPRRPWWRRKRITLIEVLIALAIIAALVAWLPPGR
jgi:prepilin-type N-terminal cleavage/methylation domain-containing protein